MMADLILTADLRVETGPRHPPAPRHLGTLSDSAEPLLGAPTSQEGPLAPWDHLMGKKGSISRASAGSAPGVGGDGWCRVPAGRV